MLEYFLLFRVQITTKNMLDAGVYFITSGVQINTKNMLDAGIFLIISGSDNY